jgi:hypothetical protein
MIKNYIIYHQEVFKLIQQAPRQRVIGTFSIEGENYVVLVDEFYVSEFRKTTAPNPSLTKEGEETLSSSPPIR